MDCEYLTDKVEIDGEKILSGPLPATSESGPYNTIEVVSCFYTNLCLRTSQKYIQSKGNVNYIQILVTYLIF